MLSTMFTSRAGMPGDGSITVFVIISIIEILLLLRALYAMLKRFEPVERDDGGNAAIAVFSLALTFITMVTIIPTSMAGLQHLIVGADLHTGVEYTRNVYVLGRSLYLNDWPLMISGCQLVTWVLYILFFAFYALSINMLSIKVGRLMSR